MSDVFDELKKFDAEYAPEGGITPGPESLPDGEYDFQITSADVEKTKKSGMPILRMGLRVVGGALDGRTLERASFLDKQKGINRLGADLITLGFDADTWTMAHGKSFGDELRAAIQRLAGVTFSGKKVTSDDVDQNGDHYHNIYINSLTRLAGMPQRPAPAVSPAPHPSWKPPPDNGLFVPGGTAPAYSDDDIPF